jgi:serine/threonine protein kinase
MAAPTFRRGDQIARRYQVVAKSGETSLWVGYHACDQASQAQSEQKGNMPEPDVLVKVVRPELVTDAGARERMVRDLQRMKGLQHPGLPRLMDVQVLEELQTVALIEAIQAGLSQGVLLRRMVTFRQKERFSLAEVRQIGAQLASVLSYIHGQMLHHGDLRLETVILRPDGTKLCDIGLGASLPRPTYLEAVRKVNESELIAPEVREGKQVDARTDVYGLAALYKHLLSLGQGQEWAAVLAEKPAMQGVLEKGMHEDPTQRYGSIEALIADIEAVARTGQPIRKRINMSPVAMAVAAGRLPAEELNRSAEDLPESARSRRNSGIFEASRISSSSASARSVRITQVGGQAGGQAGGEPAGGESSASSSSKDGPSQVDGQRSPSGTSKAGGLPSAISRSPRIGGSGRSVPPPGEAPDPPKPETAPTEPAPAAAVPGEVPAAPAAASAPAAPAAAPSAAATPRPPSEKSSRASRPSRPTGPAREPAPEPPSEPPAPATESGEEVRRQRPPRDPTSRRSPQEAATTPRPEGERSDTSPLKSSSSSEERGARPLKLPPGMIVTSKLALAGALILAALVGALVAVVVMLLMRPTVILGVPPAAVPGVAPYASTTPAAPAPAAPAPVVAPAPAPVVAPAPSAQTADPPAPPASATDKPAAPAAPTAPPAGDAPPSPAFPSAPVVPVAPPSGADPGPATPAFPTAPVVPIKTEPTPAAPASTPTPDARKGVVPPLRPAQPAHPVAPHPVGKPAPQPVRPQKPAAAPAGAGAKALPPKPVRTGPPPRPGAHPAAPTGPQSAPIF